MKKSTLVALGVFAALALAWVATREKTVAVGVHKLTLAPVTAEALTRVVLGAVTLEKDGAQWVVSADGKKHPADEAAIGALTRTLAQLKAPDFVSERAEKLPEYELDDAKGVKVTAATAQGVVRELVVGKGSRSGGDYVRAAGTNDVFVTRDGLGAQVRRPVTAWRKKTVSPLRGDEVAHVEVTPAGGAKYELERDGAGWKLTGAPASFPLDVDAAARLVSQLGALTAQDFFEGAPAEPEAGKVRVATADRKKEAELVLHGKRADGAYALLIGGDPQGYVLPGWQAEQLLRGYEGLRDLRPLHVEIAKVKQVTLTAPKSRFTAVRDGTTWKLTEPAKLPEGFEVDPQQVDRLLQEVANLRGEKLATVDEAKAGLAKAAVTVALELEGAPAKRLRLSEAGGVVYGAGDDGRVYEVAAARKQQLEQGLEILRRLPPPPQFGGGLEQLPPELRAQLEAQLRAQQR